MGRITTFFLLALCSGMHATFAAADTTLHVKEKAFIEGTYSDFYVDNLNNVYLINANNQVKKIDDKGDSVAVSNLVRLYHYTQNQDFLSKADHMIRAMSKAAAGNPFGFGQLLSATYLRIKTPIEICVIRQDGHSELGDHLNRKFLPNAITAILNQNALSELEKYPYFKGKQLDKNNNSGKEFAYVCKDFACSLPITSIKELEKNIS